MQSEMFKQEPNLLAEAYRNHTNLLMPRRIERHYDFIEFNEDGLLLLGTSNLSGRIWSGSVWVFKECFTTPDIENCVAGIEFESSVASGLWLGNEQIGIGCDSGSLHQLTLNTVVKKNKNYFTTDSIVTEHDDSIVALDLMEDKMKLVSGGMDMNIMVWDLRTSKSEKSYCPAHCHIITSLSVQNEDDTTFASTSLDGTTLIWDLRLEKPASLLLKNECGFTASSWVDENCISVGSADGSISLVDLRMKCEFDRHYTSQRPIFRLKYNKESDMLAACADDPILRVLSCKNNNLTVIYESDQHKDFIRGIAWEPSTNALYSCGWDQKIVFHEVLNSGKEDSKSQENSVNRAAEE